jgi:hypothetical protein
MQRRELLRFGAALALIAPPLLARAAALPAEVAGVALPHSARALRAAAFARSACPEFLFNHCLRTYLFGALRLRRRGRSWRAEDAFIGAALHDLGLLPRFATATGSFEQDGADAAERWTRAAAGTPAQAARVWYAVRLHDGAWGLTQRAGSEAMLVALGAAADVDGAPSEELEARELAEVVTAFPRLAFKERFTQLLVAHCVRKPAAQEHTWLEGMCRAHGSPLPPADAVEREIAAAPFAE